MTGAFRRDIEGLRAAAVLGVLLFHLSFGLFGGGFIGVDVFFVISGYLITQSIVSSARRGGFSYLDFYGRRIRRLLPAYTAMLITTVIVSAFVLLPSEFEFLGRAAIAATLFASNVLFMLRDSYFASDLKDSPLLHTWSLGVEEQFYIVFPLFAAALILMPLRRALVWAGVVAAASLLLAVWLVAAKPEWGFFFAPARFWQLLVGAALAFAPPPRLGARASDALTVAGLAAIGLCYVSYDALTPFPGIAALPPTLGTAMVIAANARGEGWAARLILGNPLAQFFGRISYSLYLWHWPMIVLYRLQTGPLDHADRALLAAASIAMGWLSWRYVEAPFRHAPLAARGRLFGGAAVAIMVCAALGAALVAGRGFEARFDPEQVRIARFIDYRSPRAPYERCFLQTPRDADMALFDEALCVPPPSGKLRIALIGDSHADQYAVAMRRMWPDADVAQITASGCRPLLGGEGHPVCTGLMREAIERIIPEGRFDHVVMAGRWWPYDLPRMRPTVEALRATGAEVTVLGPVTEYIAGLPRLLATGRLAPDAQIDPAWSRIEARAAVDRSLAETLEGSGARYVSVIDMLCDGDRCRLIAPDGTPMQFDYGHLTVEGALEVLGAMEARGLIEFAAAQDQASP